MRTRRMSCSGQLQLFLCSLNSNRVCDGRHAPAARVGAPAACMVVQAGLLSPPVWWWQVL